MALQNSQTLMNCLSLNKNVSVDKGMMYKYYILKTIYEILNINFELVTNPNLPNLSIK